MCFDIVDINNLVSSKLFSVFKIWIFKLFINYFILKLNYNNKQIMGKKYNAKICMYYVWYYLGYTIGYVNYLVDIVIPVTKICKLI